VTPVTVEEEDDVGRDVVDNIATTLYVAPQICFHDLALYINEHVYPPVATPLTQTHTGDDVHVDVR